MLTNWKQLTIFTKHSILDLWQRSEYVSDKGQSTSLFKFDIQKGRFVWVGFELSLDLHTLCYLRAMWKKMWWPCAIFLLRINLSTLCFYWLYWTPLGRTPLYIFSVSSLIHFSLNFNNCLNCFRVSKVTYLHTETDWTLILTYEWCYWHKSENINSASVQLCDIVSLQRCNFPMWG